MIISVASGKGGTGKTTVATNLAAALADEVTFLDCDVEEPNAHLFLHPRIEHSEKVYSLVPEIIDERCNACKKCAEICRFRAITVLKSVLVFPEMCHGCGGCMLVCPEQAILEGRREIGTIESGKTNRIAFNHGVLRVGEAMSPPLIKALRKKHQHTQGITIIDAPPGTSCPVIAAIKDADYILLVTEPTPFGLHDLILAHKTAIQLGVPCGLVINRSDLGDQRVQRYAEQNNLPILLEIPFNRKIAEIYSRGLMLIEEMEEWKVPFQQLYRDIVIQVGKGEQVQ